MLSDCFCPQGKFSSDRLGLLHLSCLTAYALFEDFIILSFINAVVKNRRVKTNGEKNKRKNAGNMPKFIEKARLLR